jgi:hypothetical protein
MFDSVLSSQGSDHPQIPTQRRLGLHSRSRVFENSMKRFGVTMSDLTLAGNAFWRFFSDDSAPFSGSNRSSSHKTELFYV